jgi:hypothetical protein
MVSLTLIERSLPSLCSSRRFPFTVDEVESTASHPRRTSHQFQPRLLSSTSSRNLNILRLFSAISFNALPFLPFLLQALLFSPSDSPLFAQHGSRCSHSDYIYSRRRSQPKDLRLCCSRSSSRRSEGELTTFKSFLAITTLF